MKDDLRKKKAQTKGQQEGLSFEFVGFPVQDLEPSSEHQDSEPFQEQEHLITNVKKQ